MRFITRTKKGFKSQRDKILRKTAVFILRILKSFKSQRDKILQTIPKEARKKLKSFKSQRDKILRHYLPFLALLWKVSNPKGIKFYQSSLFEFIEPLSFKSQRDKILLKYQDHTFFQPCFKSQRDKILLYQKLLLCAALKSFKSQRDKILPRTL